MARASRPWNPAQDARATWNADGRFSTKALPQSQFWGKNSAHVPTASEIRRWRHLLVSQCSERGAIAPAAARLKPIALKSFHIDSVSFDTTS